MAEDQWVYRLAITLVPGLGDLLAKIAIAYCGSPEGVFKSKKSQLLKIPGVGEKTAVSILNKEVFEKAEKELRFISRNNLEILYYLDANYPNRLKHCEDGPVILYYRGNTALDKHKMIGVVGTRNPTNYGKIQTEKLVSGLAKYNATIVSGLAYGIDILAHQTALRSGMDTIGVLGHGLDRIYPYFHKETAKKMVSQGGLITDFSSGHKPDRQNFPKRNRIVAGMCLAVVLIETTQKGGAMITADIANSYNRDVFAIPGPAEAELSAGCNYLIKNNGAALIENAEDIAWALGWEKGVNEPTGQKELPVDLDENEKLIVDLLRKDGPTHIDQISLETKLGVSRTSSTLLQLEFKGLVRGGPGKVFEEI